MDVATRLMRALGSKDALKCETTDATPKTAHTGAAAPNHQAMTTAADDTNVSDADVETLCRVLEAVTKNAAAFKAPKHRKLRAATRAAHAALTAGDFGGEDGLVHGRKRQLRKEREARATKKKDLDAHHRDSTQLRRQRIDKLRALESAQGPLLLAPDGAVKGDAKPPEATATHKMRHCYTCKARFDGLHAFYAQLCPGCADLNWRMRLRTEDLTGRVALLTGARVKIGFETGLKLLRSGCRLIATTRFPHDLAQRYSKEKDAEDWKGRLEVHGLDLRDLRGVDAFCAFLKERHDSLDILVNNACQTVRRPAQYYASLVEGEQKACLTNGEDIAIVSRSDAARALLEVAPEDATALFVKGRVDVNGQQLDLREDNSWTATLDEVGTAEVVEAQAINVVAPFILCSKLQPLLARAASKRKRAFVVNVSAMEGKFYRYKTPNHPHTNMAKAALNMMTRTCAADLAQKHCIYMTAVDTGWINDENPAPKAYRNAQTGFQTPIDEVDAAARILHPVFDGVGADTPLCGVFLKDYGETEW